MEEKIDVLMATYQTDINYLKKQIESILNQNHKNIHLMISDDNSLNPKVRETLEEYQRKDDRITVFIQPENLGYIQNFGFLLSKSTANYICFSDHDDIWYPEKLQKSLKVLQDNQVDLVYVNAKQINEKEEVLQENYFIYKNMPLVKGTSKLAITRCVGIGCSQMFTKEVRKKMLPFSNTVMAHDWLAAFIANEGKGITYVEEPLFAYRLHETNVFGGRNFNQNIARWKEKHGKSYTSYATYRKEDVIDKAYFDGAKMCLSYSSKEENKQFLSEVISYYENLEKSKYINFGIRSYFKFLAGNNLTKKMVKEIIIFHLPIVGYIPFYFG